jgi:hypothetical protein
MTNLSSQNRITKCHISTSVGLRYSLIVAPLVIKPFWSYYSQLSTVCCLKTSRVINIPPERGIHINDNISIPVLITKASKKNCRQSGHSLIHIYFTDSRYSSRVTQQFNPSADKQIIIRDEALGAITILKSIIKKI